MSHEQDDGTPPVIREYVMVLYWRGNANTETSDDAFAGHLRFLAAEQRLRHNLISGPFGDDGDLRGISIYDSADINEVAKWVERDPAVVAGHLRAEIRPWWSTPGATLPS